jgi:ribosomal protein L12E/L44/L45/RPP1/RPP2
VLTAALVGRQIDRLADDAPAALAAIAAATATARARHGSWPATRRPTTAGTPRIRW